jgi:hypothetical protein
VKPKEETKENISTTEPEKDKDAQIPPSDKDNKDITNQQTKKKKASELTKEGSKKQKTKDPQSTLSSWIKKSE